MHVASFAREAGLTPAQVIATVRGGGDGPAWSERDRLLIRFVDELHDTAGISDGLWPALTAQWSEERLLELLVLAGWYHAVAYLANGVRLALDPWAARFPQA